MINIIEKYKLYLWDSEIKEKIIKNNIIEKENKNNMDMYRVRLSWDNPDSQIYASAIYEDALKMAFKHEGYKVFINDNGEIFFDPWDRSVIVEPDNTPKAIPDASIVNTFVTPSNLDAKLAPKSFNNFVSI